MVSQGILKEVQQPKAQEVGKVLEATLVTTKMKINMETSPRQITAIT